jgi:hypothetical protein
MRASVLRCFVCLARGFCCGPREDGRAARVPSRQPGMSAEPANPVLSEPSPCDDCRRRAACAVAQLACGAFTPDAPGSSRRASSNAAAFRRLFRAEQPLATVTRAQVHDARLQLKVEASRRARGAVTFPRGRESLDEAGLRMTDTVCREQQRLSRDEADDLAREQLVDDGAPPRVRSREPLHRLYQGALFACSRRTPHGCSRPSRSPTSICSGEGCCRQGTRVSCESAEGGNAT